LGRAFCQALVRAGASVVAADVDEVGLAALGSSVTGVTMDVRSPESVAAGVRAAGPVDILINNAGGSLYTPRDLAEIAEEHWDLVLDVNLKGAFLCAQAVVPAMRKRGGGRIINVSSIGGRTASPVTGVAYAAAKAGLIGLTRRLARELGPDGITVNAIAPGTVLSGERMVSLWGELSDVERGRVLADIPLGRLSTAEEQADVVVFLAGPGARYITGAVLDVNGGRFMG